MNDVFLVETGAVGALMTVAVLAKRAFQAHRARWLTRNLILTSRTWRPHGLWDVNQDTRL